MLKVAVAVLLSLLAAGPAKASERKLMPDGCIAASEAERPRCDVEAPGLGAWPAISPDGRSLGIVGDSRTWLLARDPIGELELTSCIAADPAIADCARGPEGYRLRSELSFAPEPGSLYIPGDIPPRYGESSLFHFESGPDGDPELTGAVGQGGGPLDFDGSGELAVMADDRNDADVLRLFDRTADGGLEQRTCLSGTPTPGCEQDAALGETVWDARLSEDGRTVWAFAPDLLAVFRVGAGDGELRRVQCFTEIVEDDGCPRVPGLGGSYNFLISPDEKRLFTGSRAYDRFTRPYDIDGRTGLLTPRPCTQGSDVLDFCRFEDPDLGVPLAAGPRGHDLVTVPPRKRAAISVYRLSPSGRFERRECISRRPNSMRCERTMPRLSPISRIAVSPDARSVYATVRDRILEFDWLEATGGDPR